MSWDSTQHGNTTSNLHRQATVAIYGGVGGGAVADRMTMVRAYSRPVSGS